MALPYHDRFPYQPITRRPEFRWPQGDGLAVYIGMNLEHFAFDGGLGAQLAPGGSPPDILNYAWRDYGNRVGAWRLLDLFKALDLPCAVLANSELTDYCPELIQAFLDRGDELVGHGRSNAESQGDLSEDDESALIAEATESLTQSFNDQPRGWLGPWIAQTSRTPDLLCEAGYRYLLDWCHDDQPVWMRTRNGEGILSVPYSQEINDIPAIAARRAGAREFADMIVDQFDEMREQARSQPLALGIALHPYLVGQPFRLRPLRQALAHIVAHRDHIWLTTPGKIATSFAKQVPFNL